MLQYNKLFGNISRELRDALVEIHEKDILQFDIRDKQYYKILVKNNNRLGIQAKQMGIAALLECYLSAKILGEGPKVFCPDQMNLEAMENIEIGIELSDYNQPYPTMIVELPEKYLEEKVAYCPQFDCKHTPIMIGIHHDKEIMVCGIYFWSKDQKYEMNQCITFVIFGESGKTIEELLNIAEKKIEYQGSEVVDQSELRVAYSVARAGINALGILYETGCRRIGTNNDSYYLKLMKRIQKRQRKKGYRPDSEQEKLENDQKELKAIPVIYGFTQEIKLYDIQKSSQEKVKELEHKEGRKVRPHWRRGFRRRQHHGVGNKEIKIVTIKPVLVNMDLYKGKTSDTFVEYS